MKIPEATTHIRIFSREFGTLTAVTQPTCIDEHFGHRLAVSLSARENGFPGFVTQNAITREESVSYLAYSLSPPMPRQERPQNKHTVDLYLSPYGSEYGELVATATYGESMTTAGMRDRLQGRRIGHVPEFSVAGSDASGREFSPQQQGELAIALGYSTLQSMSERFDIVSHLVEHTSRQDVMHALDTIGVTDDLRKRDETLHWAVNVSNPEAMVRTEYDLPIETTRAALAITYPWLNQQVTI